MVWREPTNQHDDCYILIECQLLQIYENLPEKMCIIFMSLTCDTLRKNVNDVFVARNFFYDTAQCY